MANCVTNSALKISVSARKSCPDRAHAKHVAFAAGVTNECLIGDLCLEEYVFCSLCLSSLKHSTIVAFSFIVISRTKAASTT